LNVAAALAGANAAATDIAATALWTLIGHTLTGNRRKMGRVDAQIGSRRRYRIPCGSTLGSPGAQVVARRSYRLKGKVRAHTSSPPTAYFATRHGRQDRKARSK
jgi:hypothetical protein